jgi:hypothetical protein
MANHRTGEDDMRDRQHHRCVQSVTTLLALLITVSAALAADIDTIYARLYAQNQGSGGSATTINGWLSSLQADGTWPDINYAATDAATWPPSTHLSRMLTMAQAYRNPSHTLYNSTAVHDAFIRSRPTGGGTRSARSSRSARPRS